MELMKIIALIACSAMSGGAIVFAAFVVVAVKSRRQERADAPEAGHARAER